VVEGCEFTFKCSQAIGMVVNVWAKSNRLFIEMGQNSGNKLLNCIHYYDSDQINSMSSLWKQGEDIEVNGTQIETQTHVVSLGKIQEISWFTGTKKVKMSN